MDKKQEAKFEEIYVKFIKKCLKDNIMPSPVIVYGPQGIFPKIDFTTVTDEIKTEILSSLDKK